MQPLSKEKHEKFLRLVFQVLENRDPVNADLIKLKSELDTVFFAYNEALENLRVLIMEYDIKQKSIRQKIRQMTLKRNLNCKNANDSFI